MLRCLLVLTIIALARGCTAGEFQDVPQDHWAADSVRTLAEAAIVKGYPDGAYKGDKPVTRYELAVALDGMIKFIKASFQPVNTAESHTTKDWASGSITSLRNGGYLPADSPILKQPDKPVTADDLAKALASVSAKLIEEQVPAAEEPEEPASR